MEPVNLSEIFTSVEGEGINVGRPATFVRFAGCNLSCSYCDTPYAQQACETASVHAPGQTREITNPVSSQEIMAIVREVSPDTRTVVLTGGEPLVQAVAVYDLSRRLRLGGYSVHLETNGTLPDAFAGVRDLFDSVCMDIKLPSTQRGARFEREHLGFLKALKGKNAAVKIVIARGVTAGEVDWAVSMIAGVNPYLPVLLQPEVSGSGAGVGPEEVLGFQAAAGLRLRDVRISVQLHKILNVR